MRIGIDATFLGPDALYTGMGVYTKGLTTGLASLSPDHEIVLLGYGPRPAAAPPKLRWHQMSPLPVGRLSPWLSHQVVVPRTVRQLGLDVLHVTGVNLRLSRPGVPFFSPCPLVVTVHDAIPVTYYGRQGPALPWRLRLGYRVATVAMRRAAAIVTVSETSRQDLKTHLPLDPRRIHVVHNGLDFPVPAVDPNADEVLARLGVAKQYLLYAGSYEPRKNLLGAVAAYRHALARRALPPLVLLVERESGYRQIVMDAVSQSGVADHLHFVHSLSDADLATLYRNATLFIYPSHYEGFGFAPLQALACGIPVIASNTGSLPEVLGDAAYLVDPTSAEALGEAIVDLLDHPALWATYAARGPARAARFRWDDAARKTIEVYERVANRSPHSVLADPRRATR